MPYFTNYIISQMILKNYPFEMKMLTAISKQRVTILV